MDHKELDITSEYAEKIIMQSDDKYFGKNIIEFLDDYFQERTKLNETTK